MIRLPRTAFLLPALLSVGLCACEAEPPAQSSAASARPTTSATPMQSASGTSARPTAERAAARPEAQMGAVAKASNTFGLDLYGQIRAQPGNLAFGPASVSLALTMTWAGARGETAKQMAKVLHVEPAAEAGWLDACGKVSAFLAREGQPFGAGDGDPSKAPRTVELRIANRLFGDKGYTFEQPYLEQTKRSFGAPLEALDFRADVEPARRHINDWVSDQTKKRVPELLPARSLGPDTRLVLVNAMTFTGSWAEAFALAATEQAPFRLSSSETKSVATMKHTGFYRAASVDGASLVELPYLGGEMAMTIVMADAVDGLAPLEQQLTVETLGTWTAKLASERLELSIPKFAVAPQGAMALADAAKALGMTDAFEREKADFGGMAQPASPDDRLFIAQAFHRALVKIDESGTEAAAATAVSMARVGAAAPPAPPRQVKIDRPFLFFVRDVPSGLVLFMGRVVDPSVS